MGVKIWLSLALILCILHNDYISYFWWPSLLADAAKMKRVKGDAGGKVSKDPTVEAVNASRRNMLPSIDFVTDPSVGAPVYACDEKNSDNYMIYCKGELLHTVALLGIYSDSKTFVDKPLKKDANVVLENFKKKFTMPLSLNDRNAVRDFVEENFDEAGSDIEQCSDEVMQDWDEEPEFLISIEDIELRQFALDVHGLWKKLCHVVKKDVLKNPQRHSLLYVPNEFITPGGRFREYYYWDTYWIIKGLLASSMHDTAKHILENIVYMVNKYGYVPHAGRVYFLRRTHPPLFIPMVYEYHTATEDDEFLLKALEAMEKEYDFWKKHRTRTILKNGRNFTVFQYLAEINTPRSEQYRDDILIAESVERSKRRQLWRDISGASDSGWDFSSRWLANSKSVDTIETSNIVPVDLNALMCWNMEILAHLWGEVGNSTRRHELYRERSQFLDTFEAIFFDHREGSWFDFNLNTGGMVEDTYPSMAVPLFTECYSNLNNPMLVEVLETLHRKGLLQFPGGVPASLIRSSNQQWDYPNGFAPLNHMIIEGLRKSNHPILQQKAFEIASKWINRNYRVYQSDHKLWQRYDVAKDYIRTAKGGEYENQEGYGWTNGALLDLLVTYSKRISSTESAGEEGQKDLEAETNANVFEIWCILKRVFIKLAAFILKCS